MLRAVDPDRVVEYIPKSQRKLKKGEKPTTFLVQFPDVTTSKAVGDNTLNMITQDDGTQITQFTTGTSNVILLMNCLKGWKNFADDKGEQVEFKDRSEDDLLRSLSRIDQSTRDELVVFLKTREE